MTTIVIDGVAYSVRAGGKVSALYRADATLPFSCLAGRCGSCLVSVIDGNLGPMGIREREFLKVKERSLKGDVRLLCQATLMCSSKVVSINRCEGAAQV